MSREKPLKRRREMSKEKPLPMLSHRLAQRHCLEAVARVCATALMPSNHTLPSTIP